MQALRHCETSARRLRGDFMAMNQAIAPVKAPNVFSIWCVCFPCRGWIVPLRWIPFLIWH